MQTQNSELKYIFRSINFDTNLNPQTEFHLDFSLENDIVPEKPWSPGSMYVKKSKNPLFEWTYFHNWIEKLPSFLSSWVSGGYTLLKWIVLQGDPFKKVFLSQK